MRTLFFRIFLGVGSAILLALVATVLISLRLFGGAMEQGILGGPRELVRDAADVLVREGEAGLKNWLETRADDPAFVVFIIDSDGHDLLDRSVSRRWLRLARPPGRARGNRPGNYRPPRYLPRLIGPDGSEYTLVVAPRRLTALSILGWPGNRLLIFFGIVAISGLISLLLARYVARPVSRLTEATDALAEGRLDTRIGSTFSDRRDELGLLAKAFDTMAARIQRLVSERENLLRDVSHELRSPLARLKLALALAQRNAAPELDADLARIEKESDELEALIEQMLVWVRLGPDVLQAIELVPLESIVEEIINDARFQYGEDSIACETNTACIVKGNARALHSALENVILNGIQFSPAGQATHVCLKVSGESAIFTVRDNGPGVPESQLQQIFAPLFQVDSSRTPNRGGYGIGLAITARVVQHHNGNVSAHNLEAGGLEIRVQLPLAALA
jgi:signal transduction histidine kinase